MLHRDIAIRNVLLGDATQLKIADFGLARFILRGQTEWKMEHTGKLPARYMAPECFARKVFSAASDVWAFGVTMWELMTFVRGGFLVLMV